MNPKISKTITNTILAFILFVGFLVVMSLYKTPGNLKLFTVMSGSMEPELHTGSIILTKAQKDYSVGDIVTRTTDEASVTLTHRIISKEVFEGETYFKTKGDANDSPDEEKFSLGSIIGKVFFTIPYVGYVVSYAKTQQGVVLIIIIPAVIIIYDEFGKILAEIGRIRKNRSLRKENDVLENKEIN